MGSAAVTVVVATRNRRDGLSGTLRRLAALPEAPPVIVVDNASTDGTAEMVHTEHPDVQLLALDRNLGAAARTRGVARAQTPYVAFSDDDSWWAPGALPTAAELFAGHPRLGLLAARVLIQPGDREDETCAAMAASPLGTVPGVGPRVLGFIACGTVVRRHAYLAVGGFHPRFCIGAEEELLATDLTATGWDCCYHAKITAHHAPSPARDPRVRARHHARNALWTAWLRRPPGAALRRTAAVLRRTGRPAAAGLLAATTGLSWVLAERRPIDPAIARALDLVYR